MKPIALTTVALLTAVLTGCGQQGADDDNQRIKTGQIITLTDEQIVAERCADAPDPEACEIQVMDELRNN
jgi:hypothetical protein